MELTIADRNPKLETLPRTESVIRKPVSQYGLKKPSYIPTGLLFISMLATYHPAGYEESSAWSEAGDNDAQVGEID